MAQYEIDTEWAHTTRHMRDDYAITNKPHMLTLNLSIPRSQEPHAQPCPAMVTHASCHDFSHTKRNAMCHDPRA